MIPYDTRTNASESGLLDQSNIARFAALCYNTVDRVRLRFFKLEYIIKEIWKYIYIYIYVCTLRKRFP